MIHGISLGIGITFGFIIAIIIISFVIFLIIAIYKFILQRKFSQNLFTEYKNALIKEERFEELNAVNEIITKMKKDEQPKELLKNYKVNIDTYLYWKPYEDGERLVLKQDKKISAKNRNKPNKK